MKLLLIIKFFIISNTSHYRKSLLLPMMCVLIGSFIISMTLSITTGMYDEIIKRIKTFSYPYQIQYSDNYKLELDLFSNYGTSQFCLVSTKNSNKIVKINLFKNTDTYLAELKNNNYIIKTMPNSFNADNHISIGSDLAEYLAVDVGDTLKLSSILNINIVTGKSDSRYMVVSNIFQFDFLNYDSDYIFSNYNDENKKIFNPSLKNYYYNHYDYYYSDLEKIDTLKLNNLVKYSSYLDDNKELIKAMNIERIFYSIIGFFTILVAGLMIYNNTVLSFLEKKEQHTILISMGLRKNVLLYLMLISNIALSTFFMFIGIFLTYLTIYLNKNYYILNYIFLNMPFKILPMNSSFYIILLTLFVILFIVILSTVIPYFQYGNKNIDKHLREIMQ